MTPIAEVCVATGAALTGASPPVLSSEVPAGADDTTSADIARAAATGLPASATRPGRAEAKWARTGDGVRSNEGQTPYDTQRGGARSSAGTACAVLVASLRLAAAARVGACAAGMSGDAASNTVFVRNLPFNVSDEQVRAARSRRAARG